MQTRTRAAKRLLIAEDNEVNLFVITRMLKDIGVPFDVTENGIDCLRVLSENHYDLLLTDIAMPGMDGIQVAINIRMRTDEKRNIPIVAMTANADSIKAKRFEEAGIQEVLAKPFSKTDLLRCIDTWI